MTKHENSVRWEFYVHYPVPVAVKPNGDVEWQEHSEYCAIDLPASVDNPEEFISQSGYDDQVDLVDFREFSKV